ncbi:MAG: efflux RND transporter periplasmic adaptor subunit [Rhodospirillales bacterium]|nr:efflux RND transporter periplasmic adaptor subunit [Rhodospirillales bacterium]
MNRAVLLPLCLAAGLTACEEQQQPAEAAKTVRAIRSMEVVHRSSGERRSFPGVVQAVDVSQLAFEVAGNTREVKVSQGDRIVRGMVLATLDPAAYRLNVDSAEADLGRAEAELQEKTTDLDRQRQLHAKGWVAKAALDQSRAAYDSADNRVRYARSQLNLAKRDLEKTVLAAPFDGVVAQRLIEPFQEVNRGEPAFEVYIEEAMEVAVNVPETVVGGISPGLPAQVIFPGAVFPGGNIGVLSGRVTEVSATAKAANTFEVIVTLDRPPPQVRPGMSATVELILRGHSGEDAFLIPLSALLPGEREGLGYVFVYQPSSATVRKQAIAGSGVRDNLVMVREGIAAGDIIATAGVSFLRDGQEVRLSQPQ